MSAPVD